MARSKKTPTKARKAKSSSSGGGFLKGLRQSYIQGLYERGKKRRK